MRANVSHMIWRVKRFWHCQTVVRESVAYSFRTPDVLNGNGTFTDGSEITEKIMYYCHRLRWHRGAHSE
jgi:hypothetical protein